MNKASTFSNFCSVLIFLFRFFLHVILTDSTIYFCFVTKVFDSLLSGSCEI